MSENTLSIKLNIILISLIPLSLIIGPSISLINIILIGLFFIFFYFTDKTLKLLEDSMNEENEDGAFWRIRVFSIAWAAPSEITSGRSYSPVRAFSAR